MKEQSIKAKKFLNLHQSDGCFLMPNAWDAGSAKMFVASGFKAIGTTSAGIAFASGRPDNAFCSIDSRLSQEEMINKTQPIVDSVSVPVNADLEDGFGESPTKVSETISKAIHIGAVGGNIEDYTGHSEHPIYDELLAVERIRSARATIDQSGIPFVLVARTDLLNIGQSNQLNAAIDRANLYREAGADCLFVPGVSDEKSIKELVRSIAGPINVVMGLSESNLTLQQLADLGVRRVSIGGSLARSMYFHIQKATIEMIRDGTFTFVEQQVPQSELNEIFERKL